MRFYSDPCHSYNFFTLYNRFMVKKPGDNYLISTNPAKNYEIIGNVTITNDLKITQAVTFAQKAKREWKEIGVKKRIQMLRDIYSVFHQRKNELKAIIVKETGKTIRYADNEFERHSKDYEWFLDNAELALQDVITYEDSKSIHKTVFEPRGVTAVITPWNHPYGMFVWGVIPNLIAGNTVVYKASSECPLSGKLIADIISKSSLPIGVFSQIYGKHIQGNTLLHENIDFIWFTGSSNVGKKVYKIAADKFIGTIMELGGSNPGIMFDDVNPDNFIEKIFQKRFATCGQACDALKRLLIQDSIFDITVSKLKKRFEQIVIGDPLNSNSDIASLVSRKQLTLLERQVKDAVKKGAAIICGGKRPDTLQGAYYLPTLITNVTDTMRVWNEEVFGPVLIVRSFKNEEEAVNLANATRYGLGALVFSKDKMRAKRVAGSIDAGNVEINSALHWLPCNPFGGYKESGIGREHGVIGLQELCQIKLISDEK